MNAAEYRRQQDNALKALIRRVRQLFALNGAPATEEQILELAQQLLRPMENARQRTYQAAVTYLASQAVFDPPELKAYGGAEALAKALSDALTDFLVAGEPITPENRRDALVVKQTRNRVERTVSRHAQQPARETVQIAADGIAGAAWARMLTGPTSCAFCAMLASRGPVYESEYIALHRGGASAKTYHDGCDCVAVLVLDYNLWEGRKAHMELEALWQQETTRKSGKTARNAFRREWDRKVRGGETGDYIADTMK